ncbi:MAG: hypothetical protein GVX78_04880, partial [Bacteroidetes bacterium]|nr:hypothetical protein [Bacteroidota bacterium]
MNKPVHYYLDNSDKRIIAAAAYVLDHMGRDFDLSFERVLSKDSAAISIGQGGGMDFFIAAPQFKAVCDRERSLNELFMDNDGFPIIRVDHQLDYLLSAFVLLSGMQEWLTDRKDKWERFPFRGSLQDRFGSTEVAWVDVYFQKMYQILQLKLGLPHYLKSDSNVILTHDIDLLRWPIKQNATSYLRSFFSSGYKAKPLASFRELFFNTRKNIDSIL